MDKTYFLEKENIFDDSKMIYRFADPYKGIDTDNYAYTVIKQFFDLLKYYGVDLNKHISIINHYFEDGEGNNRILFLNLKLNEGKISKSHIRSKIGVLQKVKAAPIPIRVFGENAEHHFIVHNITNPINENAPGIYLFTILMEDNRPNIEFSHSILKFDSIAVNNKEAIEFAKANGAFHFLYNDCGSEYQRQEIIQDIKNGENYKFQLESFPEMEYFPVM